MAQTNTFNTRIQHKHDVEANWLKATTFAPKAGELIIYDVDTTHSSPRFKVGDGTTLVTDLPFSSAQSGEVGNALLKTGDTMEGVLKFTPDVHYGASLPETGETGQIYFVEAEEAFLENKDGVIQTNNVAPNAIVTGNVANKAITRAKLATDALYSPMKATGSDTTYTITENDLGRTLSPSSTAANLDVEYIVPWSVSSALPWGAEIAILYRYGKSVKIKFEDSHSAIIGDSVFYQNRTYAIPERFGMVALKKVDYANDGSRVYWLVTGNVEVVS